MMQAHRGKCKTALRRIASVLVAAILLVGASTIKAVVTTTPASASATGDDYPFQWKKAPMDSVLDDWKEYNRECTSAVAWWLHERNHYEMLFYANAGDWKAKAQSSGITVNSRPAPGAVAWASSHVAWVETVSGNSVTIEEYNEFYNGTYSRRIVPSSAFQYIHFKDIKPDHGGSSSGTDTPGIVRNHNGSWQWHLRNTNGSGGANNIFTYGAANTDMPIVGDWNGNGTVTPGVVRNYHGSWQWHLRNSANGGVADIVFTYGAVNTDTPIVGDWDGNGSVTPGIVRNYKGSWQWHLRNHNTGGVADVVFIYGAANTDTPIVGDWDGNSSDTPGVVRNHSGSWQWQLRNRNTGGVADNAFTYGAVNTDTPIVGDWNGNGSATPGIVRNHNGSWRWNLRNFANGGAANTIFIYGAATDMPLVGNWDGK